MTLLHDFKQAVCAELKTHLPDLAECKPHAGRFDVGELRRMAGRAPGIYVAVLGWGELVGVATGERDLPCTCAAYIVTRDRPGLTRDEGALNLAEAVSLHIPEARWGLAHAHGATDVRGQNLYSGKIDRMGVALWVVTWKQTVRIGADVWADDGTLPSEVYLGLDPDIGIGHEEDYEQVAHE